VLLGTVQPDHEQLALQVPGDGTVASLRRLLGRLDSARIEVEHLSIHTPDLDDVFFAVTGHPTTEPAPPTSEPAPPTQEALQR
jgi:ABC-2 type transport system ATP-binding protein